MTEYDTSGVEIKKGWISTGWGMIITFVFSEIMSMLNFLAFEKLWQKFSSKRKE